MKTYIKNITILLAMALLIQSLIMPVAPVASEKQTRLQQLKKQVAYELAQFRSCLKGDGECTQARQRAYLAIGLLFTGLGAGSLTWHLTGDKNIKLEGIAVTKSQEKKKTQENPSFKEITIINTQRNKVTQDVQDIQNKTKKNKTVKFLDDQADQSNYHWLYDTLGSTVSSEQQSQSLYPDLFDKKQ